MAAEVLSPDEVARVAVLGAGTMGHGIAQVAALAGCEVALFDLQRALFDAAREQIDRNLAAGVERGKLAPGEREAALSRIGFAGSVEEAAAGAGAVIEAVPEALALKRDLLARAAAAAPARALLASNTSSLSIAAIAEALPEPARARVVGMHFFNPVHIMKLVEVVSHAGAAAAAVECARGLAARMGKTPVTVRDAPGFASSRLGIALGLEAMRMVEEGVASPADIDVAMKLGYGHPMGPLELTDHVGLDVRLAIAEYLEERLGERFRPPQVLRDKVAAGELGKKSGRGFYDWADQKKK